MIPQAFKLNENKFCPFEIKSTAYSDIKPIAKVILINVQTGIAYIASAAIG